MKPFNETGIQIAKFKRHGDEALQGDVILTSIALPADFEFMPLVKDACLAYGEATGHMHKIFGPPASFELRENPKTKVRYLRVIEPVSLKHQEHAPIELPPGGYRIGIQREYNPFEKRSRQVAD